MKILQLSFCLLLALLGNSLSAQNPYHLTDGRNTDALCEKASDLISNRPKEVLFGINIEENGDVFFVMDNKDWFNKIFALANGVTADIVGKDRYACGTTPPNNSLFRGYLMQPVYEWNFKQNMQSPAPGFTLIKIGTLPANLRGKDVEGNLVLLSNTKVCFYTNFLNIDRSLWDILPMGLYTDTLQQQSPLADTLRGGVFTYAHQVQVTVPFEKNKAAYTGSDVKKVYDSLNLGLYTIRKVEIRAYSSVEGPEAINTQLMQARADAMGAAFKKVQPYLQRVDVTTAENWLEFYRDVQGTAFKNYAGLGKDEVKAKLHDKAVAAALEPILAPERKAILTIYYDKKSGAENIPAEGLTVEFAKALKENNIGRARLIEKEIADRITDNRLPDDYLNRLEIPQQKGYWELLNDREIYKYQLNLTEEWEALSAFRQIKKLDLANGKINYNICALSIFEWKVEPDSVNKQALLADINMLAKQGIDASLANRMLVNYHILLSSDLLAKYQYDEKDKSVLFIKNNYDKLKLTDEDRLSLAKYFSYYSQQQWAWDIVEPRVDQLDVAEDLVFYYVNLGFFKPEDYGSEKFKKALLNAATINKTRFCHFFTSSGKDGAGIQLLEDGVLRNFYCQSCGQAQ